MFISLTLTGAYYTIDILWHTFSQNLLIIKENSSQNRIKNRPMQACRFNSVPYRQTESEWRRVSVASEKGVSRNLTSPRTKMETSSAAAPAPLPQSFPSLEAEAAFWRERAAVAEAAARDAREELEEFQVRRDSDYTESLRDVIHTCTCQSEFMRKTL